MFNKKINKITKKKNIKTIICLTSYSKNIAEILDKHCDLILVGDSLGSVLYGMKSTKKVTLDMMINHAVSVRKGVLKSLLVVDMPHRTYLNKKLALENARKIIKYTKCDAVKLEGGKKIINIIKHLIKKKIPVMGHLGILPQSEKGKFRYKGKILTERDRIFNEAKLLSNSGVFAIVLECIETSLSKLITKSIEIPTIGIGSSKYCDGQILVTDDLIGMHKSKLKLKFVKKYLNLSKIIENSIIKFKEEVNKKKFPSNKHSFFN